MFAVSNEVREAINFEEYLQEHEQSEHAQKIKHFSEFNQAALERLRNGTKLFGDPMTWQKTQDKFRFRPGEVTLWCGVNGCLTGDSHIPIVRGDKSGFRAYKLSELYYQFNGIKYSGQPDYPKHNHSVWNLSLPTFTKSCDESKNIAIKNQIEGVVFSGEKEVFKVESEFGDIVEATKDHKFLTETGFKRLEQITSGEVVYFSGRDKDDLIAFITESFDISSDLTN